MDFLFSDIKLFPVHGVLFLFVYLMLNFSNNFLINPFWELIN